MSIKQTSQTFLEPGGLSVNDLEQMLGDALSTGGDFADLYFQSSRLESWVLENQQVKSGSHSIDRGVGIRINQGEKTGFAYTDALNKNSINHAVHTARSIARSQSTHKGVNLKQHQPPDLYTPKDVLTGVDNQSILDLLNQMDVKARKQDHRVKKVICSLVSSQEEIMVAATDGVFAADIRPMVKLSIQVICTDDKGRMEMGYAGGGGRILLNDVFKAGYADGYIEQAIHGALINLQAKEAPAGEMPVVLAAGWPGVLLHEAVGHGLEGDFNRKGSSAFSGKVGQQVTSKVCTIIDSGILPNRRGSLNIDDEGTQSQENVLIENGILRGYMQDKLNARLMGVPTTGNGRRESFAHLPMPRMTNTYMLGGENDPNEIIASVEKGLYAVNFSGGQVDITNGKFVFSASEAYMIEHGKISYPVKGATLIGDGPAAMQQVSMVGNDLAFDQGLGVCGKDGQSIPVGIGQPSLKIDKLTVGGTQV
ncbi:metalloprotease TldD [Marinicella litoralis]|uniref:Microcin-processing peptidase 2 n=1 Tax=Marinicella litoralis TaxID=644220 RepID=A0A4R6XPR5_9GAMM|nr:metalloprotease TldD [Marinicella litoralis]TDR19323.1 microcin-processing peptidase 2 [Marinicella litoralis]